MSDGKPRRLVRWIAIAMLLLGAAGLNIATPAASRIDVIRNAFILEQHFFDDGPVKQPRGQKRDGEARLTGLRWVSHPGHSTFFPLLSPPLAHQPRVRAPLYG